MVNDSFRPFSHVIQKRDLDSSETPNLRRLRRLIQHNKDQQSDAALLACVYIGSIGGSIAGCLITKHFLGGIYPAVFGMLGCMIGTFTICSASSFLMAAFSTKQQLIHEDHSTEPMRQPSQPRLGSVAFDNFNGQVIRTKSSDSPPGNSCRESSSFTKPSAR